ncbi:hypothetical protein OG555_18670 [Kribbella sp. NBC_01484]|nr:hypothetical protein [Kribbella sp. NBC_01484]
MVCRPPELTSSWLARELGQAFEQAQAAINQQGYNDRQEQQR